MERNFYTDNFESLLKEKSDEFRMHPSKRVWHSIYNDLHPGRKWPSVSMSLIVLFIILMVGYMNTSGNKNEKLLAEKNLIQQDKNESPGTPLQVIPGISVNTVDPAVADNFSQINNNTPNGNVFITGLSNNQNESGEEISGKKNGLRIVESMDYYIKSNRLFTDLAYLNKIKGIKQPANILNPEMINELNLTNAEPGLNITVQNNAEVKIPLPNLQSKDLNLAVKLNEDAPFKHNASMAKQTVSPEEKAWMDDYVLHNKTGRQKWKDKLSMQIYATPSMGYRSLTNNFNEELANNLTANAGNGSTIDKTLDQKSSLGLEAGIGLSYSLTRKIIVKGGLQLNYTSYGINADQTNHPVLSSLLLNDLNNGNPYLSAGISTFSNSTGLQPITLHNTTYQFSLPVGIAIKLASGNNMSWFVGTTLQPTFVLGGTANLISSDYKNYIADPSLIRKWNLNTGFETFINYKLGGYTLQVGPQLRYQMFSTYNDKYTFKEKLYNVGLKVGIVKGF